MSSKITATVEGWGAFQPPISMVLNVGVIFALGQEGVGSITFGSHV